MVWTLSDLNFGVPLTGFNVLQDIAPVTINSLTPTSVQFSYSDVGIPAGTYFTGQFVTGSTIPEPATWAMMLAGFAGLGLAGRRASRKAVSAVA